jgi:short chain dehydrogenase
MVQLAALIGSQALSEYRVMLGAALTAGVTPVEAREIDYQAVPYAGMGKVFDRIHAKRPYPRKDTEMTARNWLITGVSSGFGRELATQLLDRGDTVAGTVRRAGSVADLIRKYPGTFHCELLDVTDTTAVHDVVDRGFTSLGRIDVVVSNAGYGLFGAAEELSDEQVSHIIAVKPSPPLPTGSCWGTAAPDGLYLPLQDCRDSLFGRLRLSCRRAAEIQMSGEADGS